MIAIDLAPQFLALKLQGQICLLEFEPTQNSCKLLLKDSVFALMAFIAFSH